MYQGAGWHSRADPQDHYGGDDISAKLSMSPLEAVVILPESGPNVPKERICRITHTAYVWITCLEYNNHDFNSQRLQRDYEIWTHALWLPKQHSALCYIKF